jgi:transcriptional regulator with XRE-family HTH domain
LYILGWTEEEIGDITGLTRRAVNEIVKNTNFSKIAEEYDEGKPIEQIAKYYGLDLTASFIEGSYTHEV